MTGLWWSSLRTTSRVAGSSTATSRSCRRPPRRSDGTDPENLTSHEGQAERQEDLRQVQGDPPSRPGHGHLRQPAPQAAPGLTHDHLHLAVLRATHVNVHTQCPSKLRLTTPPAGAGDPGVPPLPMRAGSAFGSGTAEDPRNNNWSH